MNNNEKLLIGAAIGAAAGIGVVIGHIVTKKMIVDKLNAEYDARLVEETKITREKWVEAMSEVAPKEFATPQEALESLTPAERFERDEKMAKHPSALSIINDAGYAGDEPEFQSENDRVLTEVSKNIFTDAVDEDWDFDEEMPKRGPEHPYILEHDEFYNSEFQTTSITWYEGDGVLSDERDEHIPDIDGTVGEDNLKKFGHGSRDPNILYVRNERLDVDFEIVLNKGKYTEQVLGFIKHEEHQVPRKFRLDRDD